MSEVLPMYERRCNTSAGSASIVGASRCLDDKNVNVPNLEACQSLPHLNIGSSAPNTKSDELNTGGSPPNTESDNALAISADTDVLRIHGNQSVGGSTQALVGADPFAEMCRWMKKREICRPDVLRATSAAIPLKCCGRILWQKDSEVFYNRSFVVRNIDEFWSHSWHGEAWQKIVTLMVLKNGPPAIAAGTCAAALAMFLSVAGILPPLLVTEIVDSTYSYSAWSLLAGILISSAVFILWRPGQTVFLDKVCIHQTDAKLKVDGITSIGGFLNNSSSMLVLWDSSYISRLWCIFELAAFLQNVKVTASSSSSVSKHPHDSTGAQDCLLVRPVTLGPFTLGVYLTTISHGAMHLIPRTTWLMRLCFQIVPVFCSIHVFRGYAHSVHTLGHELQDFSMKQTTCGCCAINHVHPETGTEIMCDRFVVEACIRSWFGQIAIFEDYVRSNFGVKLRQQLGMKCAFPYSWALCALSPVLWAEMDAISAVSRTGDSEHVTAQVLTGLVATYLGVFPFMVACVSRLANVLKNKRASYALDLLVSVGGAAVLMLLVSSVWILRKMLLQTFVDRIVCSLLFSLISLMLTFRAWQPSWKNRPD
eukprot:TRINITY_DN6332_c0_g1_i1.p1 TRINITY_DN6332_c0_g1~~TRINITY_DN6332_c0_g1_i1.p1  ORF type:complete len:593 (+),score=73.61 TRINITY_DN6332_c0_g1_i1:55-1833(+)